MRALAVIPARFGSTRFPGKPLADLGGKPLIQWTYEAAQASDVTEVVVATDDPRILDAVEAFGGQAVMTRSDHQTGTDRIAEVALPRDVDIVLNVQGDEPLIPPQTLNQLLQLVAADPKVDMATAGVPFSASGAKFEDPNAVKAVVAEDGHALYFSRAGVPFCRDADAVVLPLHHWGVYAFRKSFLTQFVNWPQSPLECCEKLEQLRALEYGARIQVLTCDAPVHGVDTPEDLETVRALITR